MLCHSLFSHNSKSVKIPKGKNLLTEGEFGDLMYVLINGKALVSVKGQVVEELAEGSIVGEVSMVLPGEHTASVTAISDCEFAVVDKKHFEFMIQQTPYFATHVLETMAMRIRRTNALLPFLEDC